MSSPKGNWALRPLHLAPGWSAIRADAFLVFDKVQIDPRGLATDTVFHYSIPNVEEVGDGRHEPPTSIDSAKLLIRGPRLLVSRLNPRKGWILIADVRNVLAVCSSEFVPLKAVACDVRFAFYLYSAHATRERLSALARSTTRSHQRVETQDITKMWHAVPPAPEQRAIATFLDCETAKLDALMAQKERLIELLR